MFEIIVYIYIYTYISYESDRTDENRQKKGEVTKNSGKL